MAKRRPVLYQLYHLSWQLVDLLLPPNCGGCGRSGFRLCPDCRAAVREPPAPICDLCGTSLGTDRIRCVSCTVSPPEFDLLRSWAQFDVPVRPVLLRLKYRRDLGLADALAPLLAGFVEQLSWKPHLIVPVPLGGGRIRQRGYNQAALIAQPLALALSIRYVPHDLTRTRETLSQVGLTRSERIQNVKDAFVANSRHVRDRDVLLVDDVATTGATLSACARALRLAGARGVRAVTVARASPSIHRDVWSAEGAGPVGSLYLQEAE